MCITPVQLKRETARSQFRKFTDGYMMEQVPCGKCIECRKQRVNSWFVRLKSDLKQASSAYFITLTYDNSCITCTDNGLPTLDYKDVQKYWKRLRKKQTEKISYFLVGEYGTNTIRPHYHAIVFNCVDKNHLVNEWNLGHVHVGTVTDKSLYYTLKYAHKSVVESPVGTEPWDDRLPEKAMMSKGLGLTFLTPEMYNYYDQDPSRAVTMLGNKKLPLPRYYRDKIFTDKQKRQRVKAMVKMLDKRHEQVSSPHFPQRVEKMMNETKKYHKQTLF